LIAIARKAVLAYFGNTRQGKRVAVIAITGRKGGIGKSTITANLAAELLARRRSVVVLDADPQRSLVAWAGLGDGVLRDLVQPVDAMHARQFRAAVEAASARAARVLIDTPPGFADPALLAALCADLVLLPAGPSPLDIMAVRDALAVARQARAERGGDKPLIRFVPSKVTRTTLGRDLAGSLAELGEAVLPGIGQRAIAAEAALSGLTVREAAMGSACQEEFAALAAAIEKVLK
jgi:chromosome partitioning protein